MTTALLTRVGWEGGRSDSGQINDYVVSRGNGKLAGVAVVRLRGRSIAATVVLARGKSCIGRPHNHTRRDALLDVAHDATRIGRVRFSDCILQLLDHVCQAHGVGLKQHALVLCGGSASGGRGYQQAYQHC